MKAKNEDRIEEYIQEYENIAKNLERFLMKKNLEILKNN